MYIITNDRDEYWCEQFLKVTLCRFKHIPSLISPMQSNVLGASLHSLPRNWTWPWRYVRMIWNYAWKTTQKFWLFLELKSISLSLCLCVSLFWFLVASQGKGTRTKILTRIMVSRSEVDLKRIKETYKKDYGKTLHQEILVSSLPFAMAC